MKKFNLLLASPLLLAACQHDSPAPTTPGPAVLQAPSPLADFTLPASPEATTPLTFSNLSLNAATYRWRFGDGSTDQAAAPSHTYARSGTYQVTLCAYNSARDSSVVTKSLVVSARSPLLHTSPTIASGTYDCRIYKVESYYSTGGAPVVTTYPNAPLSVVNTGPQTLTIGGYQATYDPGAVTMVQANGPSYQYSVKLSEISTAYFYTNSDSLLFAQWSHVGHLSSTVMYYRGRRRP